jgi:hypothetical protein
VKDFSITLPLLYGDFLVAYPSLGNQQNSYISESEDNDYSLMIGVHLNKVPVSLRLGPSYRSILYILLSAVPSCGPPAETGQLGSSDSPYPSMTGPDS